MPVRTGWAWEGLSPERGLAPELDRRLWGAQLSGSKVAACPPVPRPGSEHRVAAAHVQSVRCCGERVCLLACMLQGSKHVQSDEPDIQFYRG